MSIKKHLAAIIVAPLAIASAVFGADDDIELSDKEQAAYDKALDGRTAGKPQNCISRIQQRKLSYVNDDILIFGSQNSKTIFVNKPAGGCAGAKNYTLKYSRPTASLCSGDIAEVLDLVSGSSIGGCAFGKFIPYTKNDISE